MQITIANADNLKPVLSSLIKSLDRKSSREGCYHARFQIFPHNPDLSLARIKMTATNAYVLVQYETTAVCSHLAGTFFIHLDQLATARKSLSAKNTTATFEAVSQLDYPDTSVLDSNKNHYPYFAELLTSDLALACKIALKCQPDKKLSIAFQPERNRAKAIIDTAQFRNKSIIKLIKSKMPAPYFRFYCNPAYLLTLLDEWKNATTKIWYKGVNAIIVNDHFLMPIR